MRTALRAKAVVSSLLMLSACGGSASSKVEGAGTGASDSTGGAGVVLNLGGAARNNGGSSSSNGGNASISQVIASLPMGFQQTDIGGYQLGSALNGSAGSSGTASSGAGGTSTGTSCGNILLGVVRDVRGANEPGGHPDFEAQMYGNDVTPNLVATTLGADRKPTYTSQCEMGHPSPPPTCPFGPETTTQANFNEWYRDTPGVNEPYLVSLYLAPQPGGLFTFQSLEYFPLDNAGFGNSAVGDDGKMHNFSFTTEIHTSFRYAGGETFQFQGDDDVWVFINDRLAVDLGGLHPRTLRTIKLDASAMQLGIQTGNVYSLELFHAERHTNQSTFRIDTNLSFVNCGTVESGVVR